jgi:hypothetical protein
MISAKIEKPKNEIEYIRWLEDSLKVTRFDKLENLYNIVSDQILSQTLSSDYWKEVINNLNRLGQKYNNISNGYPLFANFPPSGHPDFVKKPWKSFINKTYRLNVVNNKRWPRPPTGGWVTPDNWFVDSQGK